MVNKTFNIKIPEDLHQKLKLVSSGEKTSMKDIIVKALQEYINNIEISEEKSLEMKGLTAEDLAEVESIDFKEDALMYQRS